MNTEEAQLLVRLQEMEKDRELGLPATNGQMDAALHIAGKFMEKWLALYRAQTAPSVRVGLAGAGRADEAAAVAVAAAVTAVLSARDFREATNNQTTTP